MTGDANLVQKLLGHTKYLYCHVSFCSVEVAALPDVKFVSPDEVPEEVKEKAISFCPTGSNGSNMFECDLMFGLAASVESWFV